MSHMQRALALAREALGTTSPNPAVGAVVVRDGRRVGEGFTQPPSQSHAEVMALEQAGEMARGASIYTTLEPCCIFGHTPPCTDAIAAAGIAEVHIALEDPNPKVNGKGRAQLETSGILVQLGEEVKEAAELYEAYAKHVCTGLPFVTAKFAASLDGKIATSAGDSRWITGVEARRCVHQLRRTSDAIMVGVNTVLRDDPQLTARDEREEPLHRQPLRVILDSQGRTPPDARLLREPGRTLVATTGPVAHVAGPGVEVLPIPPDRLTRVEPRALLDELGNRGIVSLLVEGGSEVLGSLFAQRLVDKVTAFIAPIIIGGREAPSPVGAEGARAIGDVLRLERVIVERLGDDILIVGYPQREAE